MAETDLYTTVKNNNMPTKATTKIYNHFLYKAVFLSILFLLVLPLFPWQANPDSEKTNTTSSSWELLQLVFVGIAVSYGVFSKLNEETAPKCEKEEEEGSSTHTYVARLLQVSSSVFDDDGDDMARGHRSHEKDSSKQVVQTWNSQYHRGEPPIVVVAKESSSNDHPHPLLLPVRSLKHKASESSSSMIYDDSKLLNNSSSSNSLRRFSSSRSRSKSKLSGEGEEENTVLRSPIPWRSRSGRMMTGIESPLSNSSSNPLSSTQIQSQEEEHDVGPKNKSPVIPPPPPPPPPPPHNTRNNTYRPHKELRRNIPKYEDLNNRVGSSSGSRRGAIRTQSDTSSGAKFFTSEYLSQDKEIQSFIERRGSKKQFFIDDDGDDDDDDHEGKPQKYTENTKEFFRETASKDSDDESEVEEHEEEELQELASKKNVESIMDNIGPDVDKKADEFIAKFREQIRLQRIASIRTSTALLKPTKNVP